MDLGAERTLVTQSVSGASCPGSGYIQVLIAVTPRSEMHRLLCAVTSESTMSKGRWLRNGSGLYANSFVPCGYPADYTFTGKWVSLPQAIYFFSTWAFVLFHFIKFWIFKTTAVKQTLLNTVTEIFGLGGPWLGAQTSVLQASKS